MEITTQALRLLSTMPHVDMFDYLADYATEPAEGEHSLWSLRLAMLEDIQRTGPATFIRRMGEC